MFKLIKEIFKKNEIIAILLGAIIMGITQSLFLFPAAALLTGYTIGLFIALVYAKLKKGEYND